MRSTQGPPFSTVGCVSTQERQREGDQDSRTGDRKRKVKGKMARSKKPWMGVSRRAKEEEGWVGQARTEKTQEGGGRAQLGKDSWRSECRASDPLQIPPPCIPFQERPLGQDEIEGNLCPQMTPHCHPLLTCFMYMSV